VPVQDAPAVAVPSVDAPTRADPAHWPSAPARQALLASALVLAVFAVPLALPVHPSAAAH
jgi:hypothetical protein